MSLVQVDGSQDLNVKTVYYAGTDTLAEGQALCYDTDDTNAPVTSTTVDRKNLRGRRVVKPATAVLGGFAGIVAPNSAGVVGPNYVDIIIPRKGDVAKLLTKINGTKNTSIVGITNAGGYNLVTMADATFNVDVVAILLETKDTSTTAALTLCKFL